MKKIEVASLKIGGNIETHSQMVSQSEDIENALTICYAAKRAIKENVIKLEDFLLLSDSGEYYTLKNSDLPISFCYNAIFVDGFKDCLKRAIKRLEEIQANNDEIYALKVLQKPKKKN